MYYKLFKDYLDDLSRRTPSPGGGSAASLVFSLGVSLIEMAVNFSINTENRAVLEMSILRLEKIKEEILSYIDLDADVFEDALKSRHKEDKTAILKLDGITFALGNNCVETLKFAEEIKPLIKKSIMSDFRIGAKYIEAALFSSIENMEANSKFFGLDNIPPSKETRGPIPIDNTSRQEYLKSFFNKKREW